MNVRCLSKLQLQVVIVTTIALKLSSIFSIIIIETHDHFHLIFWKLGYRDGCLLEMSGEIVEILSFPPMKFRGSLRNISARKKYLKLDILVLFKGKKTSTVHNNMKRY